MPKNIKIPTLDQLSKLSITDIQAMTTPQLKATVSEIGKRLNKRLTNIKYNPQVSKVTLNKVEEEGGKFRTTTRDWEHRDKHGNPKIRPMTRQELILEAKREKDFIKAPASTVQKARTYQQELDRAALGTTRTQAARSFANRYNKIMKNKKMTEEEKKKALRDLIAPTVTENSSKTRKEQAEKDVQKLYDAWSKKKPKETSVYFKRAVERAYNQRVGELWDAFHEARERMGNLYLSGALSEVQAQQIIDEAMKSGLSDDKISDYIEQAITGYLGNQEEIRFH